MKEDMLIDEERRTLNTFNRRPFSYAVNQQQTYPGSMSDVISGPGFTDYLVVSGHKVRAASSSGIKPLLPLPVPLSVRCLTVDCAKLQWTGLLPIPVFLPNRLRLQASSFTSLGATNIYQDKLCHGHVHKASHQLGIQANGSCLLQEQPELLSAQFQERRHGAQTIGRSGQLDHGKPLTFLLFTEYCLCEWHWLHGTQMV